MNMLYSQYMCLVCGSRLHCMHVTSVLQRRALIVLLLGVQAHMTLVTAHWLAPFALLAPRIGTLRPIEAHPIVSCRLSTVGTRL